ncbi:MAG: signal peptidase II [Candidatus Eremiobacteraeota bacterium]|nr:signal peptidase II [Candidatus Eremiobacteraeota bacterium]MBV8366884.1 signal peptidase II [Candidatus Eremiobacteraeota bacterium]
MSLLFYVVAALIVGFDQLTKHEIATHFLPDESRIVIPHVLWLTYVQNHRGAFGLFGSHPLLLAAFALGVVFVFYIWYRQDGATALTHMAFGLILGGAIGNILDRVRLGYVVDFIDFKTTGYPVFNAADSAITIGVALLLLRILVHERRPAAVVTDETPAVDGPPTPAPAAALSESPPAEP